MIEVHCNAWGGTWIEALWYSEYMPFRELWFLLVEHVVKTTWLKDRGLKPWEQFHMIRNTTPLACIFECGFIDTEKDRKVLTEDINSFSDWIYNWLKEYIWFEEENDELEDLKLENKLLKKENEMLLWRLKTINSLSE